MAARVWPAFQDHRCETPVRQVHRGREAGRPGPGDQDLNPFFFLTVHVPSPAMIFY
jgi:hypothetical protein